MTEGHGGDGGVCAGHQDVCAVPVAGSAEAASYAEAPQPVLPVVNGVEINRARIIEIAHERRAGTSPEGRA